MERKKNERTNEQIVSYKMYAITTALHTKFKASSFYSSWEIFNEKFNLSGPCLSGAQ